MTEDRAPDRVMPGAAQADEPEGLPLSDGERDRADVTGDEALNRKRAAIGGRSWPHERVAH